MNRNHLQIKAPQGSQLAIALTQAGLDGEIVYILNVGYLVAGTTVELEHCEIIFDLVRK